MGVQCSPCPRLPAAPFKHQMFENISLVAKGKVLPNKTIRWNLINIDLSALSALDPCFHLERSGDKKNI